MIYVAIIFGYALLYGLAYFALDGRYRKPGVVWYTLIVVIGVTSFIAFRDVGPAPDDENYVEYGVRAEESIEQISVSEPVFFLLSEPGYKVLNYFISKTVGEYWYFPVFIFISFSLLSISIYRISDRPLLSLFVFLLFMPIIKNWYIHLRQGLALSVFLFALSLSSRKRYLLFIFSSLIHTSFFVSIGSYIYGYLTERLGVDRFTRVILFFFLAATFAWLLEDVLRAIGYVTARREYKDVGQLASFKVYITYIVISVGFFMSSKKNFGMMTQFLYGLSLYITMGFSVPYSARVFENYLPLAALSITDSEYTKNYYFYVMTIVGILAIIYLLPDHPFLSFEFSPFDFSPEDARRVNEPG